MLCIRRSQARNAHQKTLTIEYTPGPCNEYKTPALSPEI